jgi:serine/threonine-protein kinase
MMAHLQAAPPRVTELKPFLPAGFDEVIAYAMAKDPGMRFQRAADLAHAAQAALVDTTASVRVPMLPVPSADVNSYPADFAQTAAPAWWQQSGPPTMAAPPKPRRRRGRRLAVIGAVAALVAAGAGTAAVLASRGDEGASGTTDQSVSEAGGQAPASLTPTGAPATDVPASALRSTLLTAAEIPGNTGDTAVVLESEGAALLNDTAEVDNIDCVGAWAPAQQVSYITSGNTGAAVQSLRAVNHPETAHSLTQAVISFDSQLHAVESVNSQQHQWEVCGGKPLSVTVAGQPPQVFNVGRPSMVSGAVTLPLTAADGGGSCQRGLAARGNVVIDIRLCVPEGPNNVAALVSATAAKVPRQ